MPRKTKKSSGGATRLRPLGDRVLVMFNQDDWIVVRGILVQPGMFGKSYRMDGMVVAVGPKAPEGVLPGGTVYADPRTADVVSIDGTRYHLFRGDQVLAVAEMDDLPGGRPEDKKEKDR